MNIFIYINLLLIPACAYAAGTCEPGNLRLINILAAAFNVGLIGMTLFQLQG